jgi:hypothetical protein
MDPSAQMPRLVFAGTFSSSSMSERRIQSVASARRWRDPGFASARTGDPLDVRVVGVVAPTASAA